MLHFQWVGFTVIILKGKSLAIACPKLDHGTEIYVEKLTAMIDVCKNKYNYGYDDGSTMLWRLASDGKAALANASRKVPLKKMIVGINGEILQEEWV